MSKKLIALSFFYQMFLKTILKLMPLGHPLTFLIYLISKSWRVIVERENSRPITSWHVTLPSSQDTTNYKVPRIATRFCYHYSETNRNLPSVMQKKQSHINACKWWHKQSSACKQWHKQSSACKRWHKQSNACKRRHRRTNQAVTCVTNQTPPRVAHLPPNSYK